MWRELPPVKRGKDKVMKGRRFLKLENGGGGGGGESEGPLAEKWQDRKFEGLGRKTRQEIAKENQTTALRLQTWEGH